MLLGCTALPVEQRSPLIEMQNQLMPLFVSLGAEGQPSLVHNNVLSGLFEVEPDRTWSNPDGSGGGSTAYPRANGIIFFATIFQHYSWRRAGSAYPYTEQRLHGESYTQVYPISEQPPKWIEVFIWYGPDADGHVIDKMKCIVENHAKEMHGHINSTVHPNPDQGVREKIPETDGGAFDIDIKPPYLSSEFAPEPFFSSISEAKAAGCDIISLRPGMTNAVQKWFTARSLHLAIYDSDEAGRLQLANSFEIPSWYGRATVDYHPLRVDHWYAMGIRFEGSRGTGALQYLYMLVVWFDGKYDIVLLETVSHKSTHPEQELISEIDFEYLSIGSLRLATCYTLKADAAHLTGTDVDNSAKAEARWADELSYQEETGCFYDQIYEEYWSRVPGLPVRSGIARARLLFLKDRPRLDSIKEYLEKHSAVFYGILDRIH